MSPVQRAIAMMTLAMACFVGSDAFMKDLTERLSSGQAMFLRGVPLVALVVGAAALRGELIRWRVAANARVLARAGLEFLAAVTYLAALAHVPLATAYAAMMAIPLLTLPIAALALGERFGGRRAAAIVTGFIGVGLVIKPDLRALDAWSVLLLVSALFCAARDVTTRTIPRSVPSILINATTVIAVMLISLPLGLLQGWSDVRGQDWLAMAASAILIGAATQLLILSMRTAEVSVVAAFRYTAMLWALALGYAVWGEVPDALAWFGIALIVAAGLYALHRERAHRH
jgi:drug/metabolite transporter (DMT)-like permease